MEPSGPASGDAQGRKRLRRTQQTARGARTHQRALRRRCWYPPTCSRPRSSPRRRLPLLKRRAAMNKAKVRHGHRRVLNSVSIRFCFPMQRRLRHKRRQLEPGFDHQSGRSARGSRSRLRSGARSVFTWFGARAHRWQAPGRTNLRLWLAATCGAALVVIAAVVLQPASPVRSGPASGSRPAVRQSKLLLGAVADAQTVRRELYWAAARPAGEAHKPRIGKQGRRSGGATTRHLSNTSSVAVVAARYVPPSGAGLGAAQTAPSRSAVISPEDKLSWLRVERRVSRELDEPAGVRRQWNAWTWNQPRLMTIESEPA